MTDKELIEKFVGVEDLPYRGLYFNYPFNTVWNWLMKSVEKIERLGYDVHIDGFNCYISEGTPQGDGGKYLSDEESLISKIDATYKAVVTFLKLNVW